MDPNAKLPSRTGAESLPIERTEPLKADQGAALIDCPKCGEKDGPARSIWRGPTHKVCWTEGYATRHQLYPPTKFERLAYACTTCGYERQEPTKDAPPPPPPSPAVWTDPGWVNPRPWWRIW